MKRLVPGAPRALQILLTLIVCMTGCTTFSERYFIEVEECRPNWRGQPHSSFIRLDLSGHAFFTLSRFEKGWYDKRAVDLLFSTVGTGESTQPLPSGDAVSVSGSTGVGGLDCQKEERAGTLWRRTVIYGPHGKQIGSADTKRLVIFVSSNPDGLVNQISTTVKTLETSEQFAGLLRRADVNAVMEADAAVASTGRLHEMLLADTDALLRWLKGAEEKGSVEAAEVQREMTTLMKKIDLVRERK